MYKSFTSASTFSVWIICGLSVVASQKHPPVATSGPPVPTQFPDSSSSLLTSVQQEMAAVRRQHKAGVSRQDSRLSVKSLIESIENATKQAKAGERETLSNRNQAQSWLPPERTDEKHKKHQSEDLNCVSPEYVLPLHLVVQEQNEENCIEELFALNSQFFLISGILMCSTGEIERGAYKILSGIPQGKVSVRRLRQRVGVNWNEVVE